MRWERLFDDLEGQLEAATAAELAGEVSERTRHERALLTLADRLVASVGQPLRVDLLGGGTVTGRLEQAAEQWIVVLHGPAPVLVPLTALVAVTGLGSRAAPEGGASVLRRLRLTAALRGVARDRSPVHVVLVDGRALAGTIDAVARDHLDLAEHPPDELRRPAAVRRVLSLPLPAIAAVRPAVGTSSLAG